MSMKRTYSKCNTTLKLAESIKKVRNSVRNEEINEEE